MRETIPARLRRTTERLANECSVNMALWDEHSHAALRAADRIEMLERKLWQVLKDQRDHSALAAQTAADDLVWAMAQGIHLHLPTLEEAREAWNAAE